MSSSSSLREEEEEDDDEEEEIEQQQPRVQLAGEPSSSRRRSNGVWPEPFVEALATKIAVDAARSGGRLAAAPALANVFQVCSTWRAVSHSELLWHNLTRQIWGPAPLHSATWHDDYVRRHRTAYNFRTRRAVYTPLEFADAPPHADDNDGITCRRLALSDSHLACGFFDGSVRLFDLPSGRHVSTHRPLPRDRLGRFSRAVSGIVIYGSNLVFASLDGDVHVAEIHHHVDPVDPPRRACVGNVVNDGTLVDFTGCSRWWVGLYAGVPGRAFHVWNGETEELVFVGGSLTDPDSVVGWHMLTELTQSLGRVRVTSEDTGVACTGLKVMVFDLRNEGDVLGEEEVERGVMVDSVDVSNEAFLVVDNRGLARVRRVRGFDEVCRFTVRGGARHGVVGCMNGGFAFMHVGGVIRAWDTESGEFLYCLRERIGDANALVADDRHVAGCSSDMGIHLWSFTVL